MKKSSNILIKKIISSLWKNMDEMREELSLPEVEMIIVELSRNQEKGKLKSKRYIEIGFDLANVCVTLCKNPKHELNELKAADFLNILKYFLLAAQSYNTNKSYAYSFDDDKHSQNIVNFLMLKLKQIDLTFYQQAQQLLFQYQNFTSCKKWWPKERSHEIFESKKELPSSKKKKPKTKEKPQSHKKQLEIKEEKISAEAEDVIEDKKINNPEKNQRIKDEAITVFLLAEHRKLKQPYSFSKLAAHLDKKLACYIKKSATQQDLLLKRGLETILDIFIVTLKGQIIDNSQKNIIINFWARLSFIYTQSDLDRYPQINLIWLKQISFFTPDQFNIPKSSVHSTIEKPLLILPTEAMYQCAGVFPTHEILGDSSQRIVAAAQEVSEMAEQNLLSNVHIITDEVEFKDVDAAILLVHSAKQVSYLKEKVKESAKKEVPLGLDSHGDTLINQSSDQAARDGVTQMLFAAHQLLNSDGPQTAFCISRPPGHHADEKFHGFCIYNKVSIVAAYNCQLGKKVLIVDIDAHYGDGTIDWIIRTRQTNLIIINSFNINAFPHKSSAEIAADSQNPAIRNLPFKKNTNSSIIRNNIMLTRDQLIKEGFRPDLIIFSYGLDGHEHDPLGGLKLTSDFYTKILEDFTVFGSASLIALEGGYNQDVIKAVTRDTVLALPKLDTQIKLARNKLAQKPEPEPEPEEDPAVDPVITDPGVIIPTQTKSISDPEQLDVSRSHQPKKRKTFKLENMVAPMLLAPPKSPPPKCRRINPPKKDPLTFSI